MKVERFCKKYNWEYPIRIVDAINGTSAVYVMPSDEHKDRKIEDYWIEEACTDKRDSHRYYNTVLVLKADKRYIKRKEVKIKKC